MPFSNLVNIYFKYFKHLSSLQFQNSLYRRSHFYTLKVAFFFISEVEFTAFKICVYYNSISYDIVKFMTRASSEKVPLNMRKMYGVLGTLHPRCVPAGTFSS